MVAAIGVTGLILSFFFLGEALAPCPDEMPPSFLLLGDDECLDSDGSLTAFWGGSAGLVILRRVLGSEIFDSLRQGSL